MIPDAGQNDLTSEDAVMSLKVDLSTSAGVFSRQTVVTSQSFPETFAVCTQMAPDQRRNVRGKTDSLGPYT